MKKKFYPSQRHGNKSKFQNLKLIIWTSDNHHINMKFTFTHNNFEIYAKKGNFYAQQWHLQQKLDDEQHILCSS
jgi:hypothetical protein